MELMSTAEDLARELLKHRLNTAVPDAETFLTELTKVPKYTKLAERVLSGEGYLYVRNLQIGGRTVRMLRLESNGTEVPVSLGSLKQVTQGKPFDARKE